MAKKYFLVEAPDKSERQVVEKLDGYESWTVLGRDVAYPKDDDDWDEQAKTWKPNENRKKNRAKRDAMRDPDALMTIIDDLTSRIEKLEGELLILKGLKK